jgi:Abscisic acid G-protein coupled receptor
LPLQILLVFLHVPPDEAAWLVQPASFVFVGVLAFTSVRGFLVSIAQFVTFTGGGKAKPGAPSSSSRGGSLSTTVALVVAELMGTYFVSSLLLIRMSVPAHYREGITRAVGDIRFSFFHRWFDVIFVLSACSAIVGHMLVAATRSSRIAGVLGTAPHYPPAERERAPAVMAAASEGELRLNLGKRGDPMPSTEGGSTSFERFMREEKESPSASSPVSSSSGFSRPQGASRPSSVGPGASAVHRSTGSDVSAPGRATAGVGPGNRRSLWRERNSVALSSPRSASQLV